MNAAHVTLKCTGNQQDKSQYIYSVREFETFIIVITIHGHCVSIFVGVCIYADRAAKYNRLGVLQCIHVLYYNCTVAELLMLAAIIFCNQLQLMTATCS